MLKPNTTAPNNAVTAWTVGMSFAATAADASGLTRNLVPSFPVAMMPLATNAAISWFISTPLSPTPVAGLKVGLPARRYKAKTSSSATVTSTPVKNLYAIVTKLAQDVGPHVLNWVFLPRFHRGTDVM